MHTSSASSGCGVAAARVSPCSAAMNLIRAEARQLDGRGGGGSRVWVVVRVTWGGSAAMNLIRAEPRGGLRTHTPRYARHSYIYSYFQSYVHSLFLRVTLILAPLGTRAMHTYAHIHVDIRTRSLSYFHLHSYSSAVVQLCSTYTYLLTHLLTYLLTYLLALVQLSSTYTCTRAALHPCASMSLTPVASAASTSDSLSV